MTMLHPSFRVCDGLGWNIEALSYCLLVGLLNQLSNLLNFGGIVDSDRALDKRRLKLSKIGGRTLQTLVELPFQQRISQGEIGCGHKFRLISEQLAAHSSSRGA